MFVTLFILYHTLAYSLGTYGFLYILVVNSEVCCRCYNVHPTMAKHRRRYRHVNLHTSRLVNPRGCMLLRKEDPGKSAPSCALPPVNLSLWIVHRL